MQPGLSFPSKRDTWLVVVLWAGVAMLLGALPLLWTEPTAGWVRGASVVGSVLVAAFMLWTLYGTGYVLDDERLRIRSGPFRWTVPVSAVRRVVPTRNPLSSPACSLDRLRIEYGPGRQVMVSPEDKTAFLAAVVERAPQLELRGDRAELREASPPDA